MICFSNHLQMLLSETHQESKLWIQASNTPWKIKKHIQHISTKNSEEASLTGMEQDQ